MAHTKPILITITALASVAVILVLLAGCSTNGHAMRVQERGDKTQNGTSWLIQGTTTNGTPFSCSFVEFDERGDFLEFQQHRDCQRHIADLTAKGAVLLVIYCHGWKNSSQSGDVVKFNSFLGRLAQSEELKGKFQVHGVYLGWRGNVFRPYVDQKDDSYQETLQEFGGPIVDHHHNRLISWTGALPENLSYWNRKGAAEDKVSGLPMARAIFTYAAAAKDYGGHLTNRVCVIGHSFGALMLEQSLGQAMTGELTLEWWDKLPKKDGAQQDKPSLPFDLVLFVNSAAPAIYAKEMRDFLQADRSARRYSHAPPDVPVIVSLTSTADWATGIVHPIGNLCAPLQPSLKRKYTTGIFGLRQPDGTYPTHKGIRQSEFYNKTPGHQPYLINHWIVKDSAPLPANTSPAAIFSSNLATNVIDPDLFFTSQTKQYPATTWRVTKTPQGEPVTLDGLPPSMPDSNYWIISCGKELIAGHNDVWSTTTMEMYAALFRAVESRRAR
jgi:hypothetical protein